MKYVVGLLLATFGTFWAVEGLGIFAPGRESLSWPGDDWAFLALLACWLVVSQIAIRVLRRTLVPGDVAVAGRDGELTMRYVRGFGRFWYDFVIGDDWRIAAGVAAVLGVGALLVRLDVLDDTVLMLLVGGALVGVVVASVLVGGISAARSARSDQG